MKFSIFNFQFSKSLRGFTLIETLIAVLLLVSAVAGPLTIASKGLSASLIARDQLVAFYLAQDAVEYVRFVRDTNKLTSSPWLNGLDACATSNGCMIDPSSASVTACVSGGCELLRKHVESGSAYFTYSSSDPLTPQRYLRTITLTSPSTGGTGEQILSVSVSWRQASGVTRTIVVKENIFDWQ